MFQSTEAMLYVHLSQEMDENFNAAKSLDNEFSIVVISRKTA
jgi:hypothetical protein